MADIAAHGADARPRVVAGLRLLTRVGSGGEGEVWEARDADGVRRALKLIRPEVLPDPEELARRGAHLRRIEHPALVRVHRTGRLQGSSLDGWGFLEMEFIDGEPLGQAPADPSALDRLEPLAEGLDALHRGEWSDGVPLVHRDVKPANLISRPSGEVVLVDCSTLRGTDATQLSRVGTPVFAAPEVLTGRMGPAADVYSFGATIVALVTGARGEELARLLAEPERLDLPGAVGRALLADAAARPRSCRAVLDAGAEIDLDLLPPLPSRHDWEQAPGGMPRDAVGEPVDWDRPDGAPGGPWADESHAGAPAARLSGWLLALACCVGLAWAATAGRAQVSGVLAGLGLAVPTEVWAPAAGLTAVGVHVLAARLAGQPWVLVLLLPPVAWAWLLGARSSEPGTRRAWVRTVLVGALVVGAAAGLGGLSGLAEMVPARAAAITLTDVAAACLGLAVLAPVAGRGHGVLAAAARLLLAPAWLVGAVLLLVAALVAAAIFTPLGRSRLGLRLAAGTLAGSGAFLGLRGALRHRQDPDPRA